MSKNASGFWDWVGLGLGTFCARTWKFGDGHYATLEHDCMIGRRILHVNGKEIYNETIFPDRSFELTFSVNGKIGKTSVVNVHKELAIYYTLEFDGKKYVSTVFEEAGKAGALDSKFDVSIPKTEFDDDGVTKYCVRFKKKVDESATDGKADDGDDKLSTGHRDFHKRFSDFVQLHQQVWSSFAGSHLLDNVPAPPSRKWKMFTDHKDPAFIEKRRAALEEFIQKLMAVPRIGNNVYVYNFFEETAMVAPKDSEVVLIGHGAPGAEPVLPGEKPKKETAADTKAMDAAEEETAAADAAVDDAKEAAESQDWV